MGRETAVQLADRFAGFGEIWLVARREEAFTARRDSTRAGRENLRLISRTENSSQSLRRPLQNEQPDVKIPGECLGIWKDGAGRRVSTEEETGMVRLNCEALCAVTPHGASLYEQKQQDYTVCIFGLFSFREPGFAIYAATKSFVLSSQPGAGEELKGRGICVTAVCPGPVKTEFLTSLKLRGRIPLYKRLTMADPVKVVKLAIRDSLMGKPVSVYGFLMKSFRLLCKTVPHGVMLKIMSRISGEAGGKPG